MASHKSLSMLLVAVGTISAIALAYVRGQRSCIISEDATRVQVPTSRHTPQERQSSRRYGKIRVPADLFIELVQPANVREPVAMIVSASSLVPVSSGVITLRVPRIDPQPECTEVLWSGTPSGFVAETAEYTVNALPVGKYRFVTIFEFTPDGKDAEKLVLSKSLYLDVRPTVILSSNVSFSQIERVELRRQLEERALIGLRPELRTASRRTMAREMAAMEARNPGIIARKVAELKATDPEVARRIMELHRARANTMENSGTMQKGQEMRLDAEGEPIRAQSTRYRGRPAPEKAVPIPERYRD